MMSAEATVLAYWTALEERHWEAVAGLVREITEFWPAAYEPPTGREHLAERY